MCGIAGAFRLQETSEIDLAAVVKRLNEHQADRGPDGEGLWKSEDGRLAFGHRRLAIIDTGQSGAQPMFDASRRWVITFNGEIYNYAALRAELESNGALFRTNSDTEVIIQAVSHWGEDGLKRLRGMYAFALWDIHGQELWLARDPFGIKPLYVAENKGTVWFASQAKALSRSAPVDLTRDPAAIAGFYLWGHVPEPFTWWRGISMLPAGHVWRIAVNMPPRSPVPFCKIERFYESDAPAPLNAGKLKETLLDTVRHHLVADVDVGIFLSAGIDSTVIASTVADLGIRPKTVTLAFDEYRNTSEDESLLAEQTARVLGSDHYTARIKPDEFESLLGEFLERMDQPTIDGLNTFLVSRAARSQGLKVALSGIGADEIFGGYPSFTRTPKLMKAGRAIRYAGPLARLASNVLRRINLPGMPPKLAGAYDLSSGLPNLYLLQRALFLPSELDSVIDASWIEAGLARLDTVGALARSLHSATRICHPVRTQVSTLECCWYMRNQLLRDADWASMAHGVEIRVPFVDLELLKKLGPAISSQCPPTKTDLATCARTLPSLLQPRKKTGFTTPVARWTALPGRNPKGLRDWARLIHRDFSLRNGAYGLEGRPH